MRGAAWRRRCSCRGADRGRARPARDAVQRLGVSRSGGLLGLRLGSRAPHRDLRLVLLRAPLPGDPPDLVVDRAARARRRLPRAALPRLRGHRRRRVPLRAPLLVARRRGRGRRPPGDEPVLRPGGAVGLHDVRRAAGDDRRDRRVVPRRRRARAPLDGARHRRARRPGDLLEPALPARRPGAVRRRGGGSGARRLVRDPRLVVRAAISAAGAVLVFVAGWLAFRVYLGAIAPRDIVQPTLDVVKQNDLYSAPFQVSPRVWLADSRASTHRRSPASRRSSSWAAASPATASRRGWRRSRSRTRRSSGCFAGSSRRRRSRRGGRTA